MRAARLAALTFAAAAGVPVAAEIVLQTPVDCALGDACYIQQYVDHDPGPGASDYRCAPLSYDTHTGTDFALPTWRDMAEGVDVVAAAPGTVRGMRDGMQDKVYAPGDSARVAGRGCGNGVVVDHADGWSTQYCHLKRGSVTVRSGDRVAAGTVLGQIGMSGRADFPHLELILRKDDAPVDPFDPDGQITCGAPSDHTLWETPPAYRPGGLLDVGFSDAVPEYDAIKAGEAARAQLPVTAPALVVFGYAFGSQAGDEMHLRIDGPVGTVIEHVATLDRTQALLFRATGKRLRDAAWPAGQYRATVTMVRDGQEISVKTAELEVR
ncbi:peptidoglycan DD-metalloendopeptidase family protein [uncultured Tateyamaria sp.]|uniref:M23 family metallopeptidase n=1 Tax=Tateyamaria sp. 1078 TaxID=3417464 RepID=UPI00261B79E1|nr:peptidoglycan DD-metalloendopeptidase family protein [uncultured Tateyamaria sp.]